MDNVLFTISIDNNVTVWAPINSWEPHILYQRTSISMNAPEMDNPISTGPWPPAYCILVDSAEVTKALETIFNRTNGVDFASSDYLSKFVEIARKGPDICLVLKPETDSLYVWGIDVSP
jgi:hypothetical protein